MKVWQCKRVVCDFYKVASRGVVILVVKAVWVLKMGVSTSKLRSLGVHFVYKNLDVAVADIIGKHHCGVVARGNHKAVEQVDSLYLFADMVGEERR